MAEAATITVSWTERQDQGSEQTWAFGDVIVARGRETCTHESKRLSEGTLTLAREMVAPRHQRRVRQVNETVTAARTPHGIERRVVREYLVLGIVD